MNTQRNLIFVVAIALRGVLCVVNNDANDDHLPVVSIMEMEHRWPTKDDCFECYHSKLWYVVVLGLWKIEPFASTSRLGEIDTFRLISAQLLNGIAGILTICIVYKFLKKISSNEKIRLICFALVALNPKLIGINAQATNDTFVILFSTAAIYYTYSFISNVTRLKYLFLMFTFITLAASSKANGFLLFLVITPLAFVKIIANKTVLTAARGKYFVCLAAFCAASLIMFSIFGQWKYNCYRYGAPFVNNVDPDPFPRLFQKACVKKPGVASIASAFFTFRLIDLIKHPQIVGDPVGVDPVNYPLHRTSLWSQLYGGTHFVFYDQWPLGWKTTNKTIIIMGRVIFLLALLPTAFLLLGLVRGIVTCVGNFVKYKIDFYRSNSEWIFLILFLSYLCAIMCFAVTWRHFSSMRVIYIYPAILPAIYLCLQGADTVYKALGDRAVFIKLIDHVLVALFICYSAVSASLILILW